MDLICVGEILVDFTPGDTPESYVANPGGAPANVAVAAARSGLDVGFCGKAGDDHFGRLLAGTLASEGVAFLTPGLTPRATTTMAFVSLDGHGERSFTFARKPGADMLLEPADIPDDAVASARMVHAGSCSLSAEPARSATLHALRWAHGLGKATGFDVNYRDAMWNGDAEACARAVREALPAIDFLKVSDEETAVFGGIGAFSGECFASGVSVVVETLGPDGALALLPDGTQLHADGMAAETVDTTGAGDAFWGAFLSHLLIECGDDVRAASAETIASALSVGNAAGSICVERRGAIPAIPNRIEILKRANGNS